MECEVLFTDEFEAWWNSLDIPEQTRVNATILMLQEQGIALGYPYSSKIKGSSCNHMRELRIQHEGHPYRVLYAFDQKRSAVLLIGGEKTGDNRWYEVFVPVAERLYAEYLKELEQES